MLVNGTLNVVEAALKHNVKKVVAASSASVYGEPSYLPMDESHPFNNRTMYGAGKIANEQIMRALHERSGLHYVAFRPFNVYGPTDGHYGRIHRGADSLAGCNRCEQAAVDIRRRPAVDGFRLRRRCRRANVMAASSDANDDVFNVGTGVQTSLLELCRLVLR